MEPGYPIGSQNGSYVTITALDFGSAGRNDPQLWVCGFDESAIGDYVSVTVDSDGLTGWTKKEVPISEIGTTPSRTLRTLAGKYLYQPKKTKIVLFRAYTQHYPENGTYQVTINGGGINTNFTIVVSGL